MTSSSFYDLLQWYLQLFHIAYEEKNYFIPSQIPGFSAVLFCFVHVIWNRDTSSSELLALLSIGFLSHRVICISIFFFFFENYLCSWFSFSCTWISALSCPRENWMIRTIKRSLRQGLSPHLCLWLWLPSTISDSNTASRGEHSDSQTTVFL